MDVREIRLKRLLELIGRVGQKELADKVDIDTAYISQIKNPKNPKNIGEKLARRIEIALALPNGWMDVLHESDGKQPTFHNPELDPFLPLINETPVTVRRRIPVISYVQAGNWCTLVDNFAPGDADEWVETSGKYSATTYALRVNGTSMQPTINDGAIIIVDPQAEWGHNKIVVVRQNGDDDVTVKRLIKDGAVWFLKPDNDRFPIMTMRDDAHICGVVVEMIVKF